MNREKKIYKQIQAKVKELYAIRSQQKKRSRKINYGGRVYDHKDLWAVVESGLDFWLTLGKKEDVFLKKFNAFLGTKYAITVNSGSAANLVAISTLCSKKVKGHLIPGDEVITPALAFPTTVAPIIQNNLVPVFVDCQKGTYNIQPKAIEKAITKRTKAIVFAHTLGNPCDMPKIMKIAKEHKLFVVEDVCDALGAKVGTDMCGTFADIATFSFYPAHHITMGEGGAVVFKNPELFGVGNSLRDWGRECKCKGNVPYDGLCRNRFDYKLSIGDKEIDYDHRYVYTDIGYNLKPTDMQISIGISQIKKIKGFIQKRNSNFKKLFEGLSSFQEHLILPYWQNNTKPSWFAFPITIKEGSDVKRKQLVKYLEEKGIETRFIFGGNILRQPAFSDIKHKVKGKLSNTDLVMANSFFIGVYPGITDDNIQYIIKTFRSFFKKFRVEK